MLQEHARDDTVAKQNQDERADELTECRRRHGSGAYQISGCSRAEWSASTRTKEDARLSEEQK
jgi:hypothetical protein